MTQTATDISNVIESWMTRVAGDRGDLRFQDLHIDWANKRFSEKRHWLQGAVECFGIATHIRNDRQLPFLVAVGIDLKGSSTRNGLNFFNAAALDHELGSSPPSLYLFERPGKSLLDDPDVQEVGDRVHLALQPAARDFLREWFDARDNLFRRSFWLLG
jgi:hypothetical protein